MKICGTLDVKYGSNKQGCNEMDTGGGKEGMTMHQAHGEEGWGKTWE